MDAIMTRPEVYAVIDGERDYQDTLGLTSETDGYHTPTEFLLYIDDYLREAKTVASRTWGPGATPKVLDLIRKITTLGVACMEQNGAIERTFKVRDIHGDEFEVGNGISLVEARELVADGYAQVVR